MSPRPLTYVAVAWFACACAPGGDAPTGLGSVPDEDAPDGAAGASGDGDRDAGGDGGGDGGDPAPEGADPLGADPVLWEGERIVKYEPKIGKNCTETLADVGEQLYGPGYAQLEAACAACQRVFGIAVEVVVSRCISQGNAPYVYRGLEWRDDGTVWVHRITEDGARYVSEELAEGSWDGTTLTYSYSASDPLFRSIVYEGSATFP